MHSNYEYLNRLKKKIFVKKFDPSFSQTRNIEAEDYDGQFTTFFLEDSTIPDLNLPNGVVYEGVARFYAGNEKLYEGEVIVSAGHMNYTNGPPEGVYLFSLSLPTHLDNEFQLRGKANRCEFAVTNIRRYWNASEKKWQKENNIRQNCGNKS